MVGTSPTMTGKGSVHGFRAQAFGLPPKDGKSL
jgi:hypothetical protein